MRSKPIGRDRQGHAYWVTQDKDCNIRIYQEHLDEEIWQVVATNREEFVNLLKRLRGSEVVLPCNNIDIVDEDTSSSSQVDMESVQKLCGTEEVNGLHFEEQKVPKISIKLHGRNAKETNEKDLGKGEEELAAEEDAKLLKKSISNSNAIESIDDEFEEIEEDYDENEYSEVESEDNTKKLGKNNKSERNLKEIFKLKDGNKVVKPLLISQNKVINNKDSATYSLSGKKRALDQVGHDSQLLEENYVVNSIKKSRPSLLGLKHSTYEKKCEEKKILEEVDCEKSDDENVVEEEIEEEDIDSVAAEEDENEEKLFDDYGDEYEEDPEVGEEVCDPIMRVVGEGSGKDCDVENYLYYINYDSDSDTHHSLSDTIEEDIYYFYGEGNGKDCLIGNNKSNEDTTTTGEKSRSDILKSKAEEKIIHVEKSLSKSDTKMYLENTEYQNLSTSKKCVSNDDNSKDKKYIYQDLCREKKNYEDQASENTSKQQKEEEKQINFKDEISQINGEKKSEDNSKPETLVVKLPNAEKIPLLCDSKIEMDGKISETINKDNQISNNMAISKSEFSVGNVPSLETHSCKMSALESLKKELRESKQKQLGKKLQPTSEDSNLKRSNLQVYNRKRRLTDQLQATTVRPPNSESEIELISENAEDIQNDNEPKINESEQDVGGKRLKIRPKQANTELRKKIEAQKVAANAETTSSSGSEEDQRKRKNIISNKQTVIAPILKPEKKLQNLESRKDICKQFGNFTDSSDKFIPTALNQQQLPIEQPVYNKSAKTKQTLVKIIEKKLKKAQEKHQNNLDVSKIDSNIEDTSTAKKLFCSPNKSLITKPLKKNLLIQTKQVESDKDEVPRKRTSSEEINSPEPNDNQQFENSTKGSISAIVSKTEIERKKSATERQRKRRSSEETVQNESPEEPEAKKEVSAVKEKLALKSNKPTTTNKEELNDFQMQKETLVKATGRRSSRRGRKCFGYVDTLHSKRNFDSAKNTSEKEIKDQNIESFKEKSNNEESNAKCQAVNQNNENKLLVDQPILISEDNGITGVKVEKDTNFSETVKIDDSKLKSSSKTKTPVKGVRKQREVDTTNIIDIDSETPVRQSRRIAQQKIREEAERRKLEEIALRTMKQELKKKKKAEKQIDPTVIPPTEPSSESEESDVEIKRKVQKKKRPGKNGNWSSGSEEQEEPEEDDEEPPHYETDPGSPLFKSDHEFSPESDIEDETQVVPMKRARTVRKEDADDDATAPKEEACQKCNKSDHPEWILLCDNCDKGYHCSCLSPVLFYIPEGDWFCPPCQQEQLIKALENHLKEFDDLVENKRKMEELEKLMAEEEKARQEKELEIKNKSSKDKGNNAKRKNINSSSDELSQEDDCDEDELTNSDTSAGSNSKKKCSKNKNKHRSRNLKKSDKRNHRDRRLNAIRRRRNRLQELESASDTDSKQHSESKSSSSYSSTYSESDNEPIYKLRKRRQINVSYRLNEYDDLINSALKKEMDDVAGAGNLGRGKDISTIIEADKEEKARQKQKEDSDVTNPKEDKVNENEKAINVDSVKLKSNDTNKDKNEESIKQEDIDSDAEPIARKLNTKPSQKKKARKLTTLDISSEGDDESDEDFKGSSVDDEEDEDTSISASNSDSSLEIYKRHGKFKKKRRKAARRAFRERRRDKFFVDDSDDEDVQRPKSKKKRKAYSDYTESEADDDDISELSENIDSADLCDDTTTDESDTAWRPNKRKKAKKSNTSIAQNSPKSKGSHTKKSKKVEYSDDDVSDSDEEEDDDDNDQVGSGKGMGKQPRSQPLKISTGSTKTKGKGKEKTVAKAKKNKSETESSQSNSEDSTRRTRGRRYAYIEDFDDDSSDGGIKPGVQRPDTPPEEREKFIKRQEEIKRMLAEKNAEGAKLAATPRLTPIKTDSEKDKRSPAKATGDSLSTVPLSVIRQAKVLDIDYLQRRGENLEDLSTEVGEVDDDFDDADLPDDLPEDMDEDAIARMVEEEEEFGVAARDLPISDEVLRTTATVKPTKTKDVEKPILPGNISVQHPVNSPQAGAVTLPSSGLQEPVRKRLPMPTMHPPLLRHQFLMQDSTHPNTHHLMQRHGGPHTSHLLQNALSAPLTQHLNRNYSSTAHPATHQSLINRMNHSIPLQPTVSHALSTSRPPHPLPPPINSKSSTLSAQPTQDKTANPQNATENKPRGRRKKITPLRDTLQKQQTAAAVTAATASSSALASSLVKNNDHIGASLLSTVIKSGHGPKLSSPTSGISHMPPTSHSATIRSSVLIPPMRGPYVRTDGSRFYDALGNRIPQTSVHRHRGSPQIPPSLLPPNPANRPSYGPPPPLKGSNSRPPVSSSSSTPGSIRNPIHHVPPYLGMPPNARHSSHLNIYRPPIYGNPNFGPRVNLRPPNINPTADYPPGSRGYSPYGFYPPPPPLTAPNQRPGPPGSVTRSSTHMPPVQSTVTHPPASVIVSVTSSKSSNAASVTPQPSSSPTHEVIDNSSSSKSVVAANELSIKISPKSSSPTLVHVETERTVTAPLSMTDIGKKLTTLQAYTEITTKKSSMLLASESSRSRSPLNPATGVNTDSSGPGTTQNTPTTQEGQASEFSGLVSYFSSQQDDYNT